MLTVRAPAKLNLSLSVGRRRSDGMHPLVSVMQSIDLYDEVTVAPAETFTCSVQPEGAAPSDGSNLAVRAAQAFAALHFEDDTAVAVSLLKRIPSEAGLGGGSADAAAVLVALNEATGGTVSRKALERIAATLGSDVPFCVRGGTAVVTGTGEQVTSIPCPTPLNWVLGIPSVGCSTAAVYAKFDELGGGADLDLRGAPHEMADALSRGDIERVAGLIANDLEEPACSLEPSLAAGRDALMGAGATKVVLSGSGSAWAGLCLDADQAGEVAAKAEASGAFSRVLVARSVPHGPTVLDGAATRG